MTRYPILLLGVLLVLCAAQPVAADEAMDLAVKLTTEGAATFDTKDAKAMAAYYLDDATVTLTSKDKNTGEIKTDVKKGKAEIEQLYQDLFKDGKTTKSKNTVELARLIDSSILVIYGTFNPDVNGDLAVQFFQVRVKQGEKWMMSSVQLVLGPVVK